MKFGLLLSFLLKASAAGWFVLPFVIAQELNEPRIAVVGVVVVILLAMAADTGIDGGRH